MIPVKNIAIHDYRNLFRVLFIVNWISSMQKNRKYSKPPRPHWTFLSNHAHVLICLVEAPQSTLREVADRVGITERAVQGIVADLEAAAVITRRRDGRRNVYDIHPRVPLRHQIEAHRTVGDLISAIL